MHIYARAAAKSKHYDSFTRQHLKSPIAKRNFKKVTLESGEKSPFIVLNDANSEEAINTSHFEPCGKSCAFAVDLIRTSQLLHRNDGQQLELVEIFVIDEAIARDKHNAPLVSFTRSKLRLMVKQTVNQRFGECLPELSGNNVIIVMEDVDVSLAVHFVLFVVVGTAGQCCITSRRLLIYENIYQLVGAFQLVEVGDPLEKRIMPTTTGIRSVLIEIQQKFTEGKWFLGFISATFFAPAVATFLSRILDNTIGVRCYVEVRRLDWWILVLNRNVDIIDLVGDFCDNAYVLRLFNNQAYGVAHGFLMGNKTKVGTDTPCLYYEVRRLVVTTNVVDIYTTNKYASFEFDRGKFKYISHDDFQNISFYPFVFDRGKPYQWLKSIIWRVQNAPHSLSREIFPEFQV